MQGVDFSTLVAASYEIQSQWVPARVEQVYQRDRYTLYIALRTVRSRGWLLVSWHPQAARICMADPPPRSPDTFTFSDQLRHQLNGLALVDIGLKSDWERVLELKFAKRPQEPLQWSVMVEVMNKYSNVILTNCDGAIVTAAHQVNAKQSRLRSIQTGDLYSLPPKRLTSVPSLEEGFDDWQERLSLIPKPMSRAITQSYSGLSSALVSLLLQNAGLPLDSETAQLSQKEWVDLYEQWQWWLGSLAQRAFIAHLSSDGYSVFGKENTSLSVSQMLCSYYDPKLESQAFQQMKHQLMQCLATRLKKLRHKQHQFQSQLAAVDLAEEWREKADLLMAYLHEWTPGLTVITLPHFETAQDTEIELNPELNAVQNAQRYYKRHQKLKRSQEYLNPLIQEGESEISYLEQVEDAIAVMNRYTAPVDLTTLEEIRDELVQQGYLSIPDYRKASTEHQASYRTFATPNQFKVLVGRNNQQNDRLTFRTAGPYDLWFHAQEISGSHVLLRLDAGAHVEDRDLAFCANVAAYFSRARQSDQVPVVYTQPKYVFKPRGAKPGMTVYTHEKVLWGEPHAVQME